MTVIDATASNKRRYYMIDVDVDLSANSANSICKAYRILCEADRFDFVMNGVSCRSENINGAQAFAFPDDIRSKFVALLKSIASFTKQLASLELNAREIDSFLAEFLERRTYATEARRVLREALSLLDTSDARVIVALARLLERKMDRAMATIEVTITADMLEAKRKRLDNSRC
jgi:hypothetical protein